MRIEDEPFLAYLRDLPCCFCGTDGPSQVHHVYCKGHGSGSRLDVPVNCLPLCHICHFNYQEGEQQRAACWRMLDHRLGLEAGQAEAAVHALLRRART